MSWSARWRERKISAHTGGKVLTELTEPGTEPEKGGFDSFVSTGGPVPVQEKSASPALDPLSTQDEATIRAWLEHIGETDPEELARVWERCRTRLDARAYVLVQAAQMPATASPAGRVARLEEAPA